MADAERAAPDPDHRLVDHLISHQPPTSDAVVEAFGDIREAFRVVGHLIVSKVPRTPDRAVAIRSIHRACMDSIAALALNQELVPKEDQ